MVGVHLVNITLNCTTGGAPVEYNITINVTNTAPKFNASSIPNPICSPIFFNSSSVIAIPAYFDAEWHNITVNVSSTPPWVTSNGTHIILNPTNYTSIGVT